VSDVWTFRLPMNGTYSNRTGTYVRASDYAGVVEVHECNPSTKQKPSVRRYALKSSPWFVTDLNPVGERFMFTKPGGEEFYYCLAAPEREHDQCECRAFETGKQCVHLQVLRELLTSRRIKTIGKPGV